MFMKKVYNGFDTASEIEPTAWREVLRIINEGTVEGLSQAPVPPTHDELFYRELRHSNEIFAAFKVHTMGNEMAAKLYDANGNLKPFDKWARDVSSIASHQVGSWLQTEYDTAVIRAHAAADWKEFERNRDIMPNLRWMPTTSPEPESSHRQYWQMGLTLPIDDPFWNDHHPGDRWNCKCSLEATDEPVNRPDDMEPTKPQRGLENNPGKDGHTFNDSHPYFPKDCNHCPVRGASGFTNKLKGIFVNQKKNCYNCQFIDNCVTGMPKLDNKAGQHIAKFKESIDQYNGVQVKDDGFVSGALRILRRSLTDAYEHNRRDVRLLRWLSTFDVSQAKGWKHAGWAENRPYKPTDKKYDPKNPNKKKHDETEYFNYYKVDIEGETYWANVKIHKGYHGEEVLYTIEPNKPEDLIPGRHP